MSKIWQTLCFYLTIYIKQVCKSVVDLCSFYHSLSGDYFYQSKLHGEDKKIHILTWRFKTLWIFLKEMLSSFYILDTKSFGFFIFQPKVLVINVMHYKSFRPSGNETRDPNFGRFLYFEAVCSSTTLREEIFAGRKFREFRPNSRK